MIDTTTANLKRIELHRAYAERIKKLIADLDEAMKREDQQLVAQLARITDHE